MALGFAASSLTAFAPLAGAVISILFRLGWFTVGQLVDTSIQSVVALERVSRIRAYYTTLTPDAQRRRDWRAECVRRLSLRVVVIEERVNVCDHALGLVDQDQVATALDDQQARIGDAPR